MNKRQKEVLKAAISNEETVIKRLKQVYGKSLNDIMERSKELQAQIDSIRAAYNATDDEDRKAILKSMEQSKIYQKQYQDALKKQVSGILDTMQVEEFKTIDEYLRQCYEDGFIGTMYDLQNQGIPLCIPLDQEAMVQAVQLDSKISQGLYTRLGEDVALLKKKITAQVSRGISSGYTFQQIAQQLSGYTKIGYNNAIRIARTEGHRIQCQSAMNACHKAKENGADIVKQWDGTLDKRTRDSHAKVDGEIRELDEPFSNGLMFPGDPNGKAEEVIHCRCALLQRARKALDEEELQTLKDRAAYFGLDKTKSFDDYKQKYLKATTQTGTPLTNAGKSGIIPLEKCTDFDSVEDYMTKTYSVTVDSSVKKLDFESVKEGIIGIEKVMIEFPQAQGYLNGITTGRSGIMCASYGGEIKFNPHYYMTRKTAVAASQSTGFHPKGNNVISTGSHEMGHILEKALIDKNGAGIFGSIAWSDCTYAKAVVKEACSAAKKTAKGKGKLNRALKNEISGYALTDASECMAEAVADYIINGENAAVLSVEIWKILKRELG